MQCYTMYMALLQVAQHLSNTYGDRAYKVAKLAQLTGKRWPVVGRKLHEDYPYLEAEVRNVQSQHIWPFYLKGIKIILCFIVQIFKLKQSV